MTEVSEIPPEADYAYVTDPSVTDPQLLRDHSRLVTYRTSRFEYPDIRVFFRPHSKAAELPTTPAPLPLLVCIPGLGGSVAQFHPLLSSLVDLAPCLSVDYPGGGRSAYTVTAWEAYTPDALCELLELIIEDHRDRKAGQGIVLIGHSMGTAIAANLTSRKACKTGLGKHVMALVAICPLSGPPDEKKSSVLRKLLWLPDWIFAIWRAWDGRGNIASPSISRFVGEDADTDLRVLQYRFNQQSRTAVWRRMAWGALPVYKNGKPTGGLPGLEAWANITVPVYLIAGEKDHLTPPDELRKIVGVLNGNQAGSPKPPQIPSVELGTRPTLPTTTVYHEAEAASESHGDMTGGTSDRVTSGVCSDDAEDDPTTPLEFSANIPAQLEHPPKSVHSFIMLAPANHALLYMPQCSRALAGLISDFLAKCVTQRLSLAWQLQYLSREGKWDVKNLNKWKSVAPTSEVIGSEEPIFRAMKTLREADEVHSPTEFAERWGSVVKDIIDISKDQPVYDPRGLERCGIHYHKFPTVSKIPPQPQEVDAFIRLVDNVRAAQKERAVAEGWSRAEQYVIGVHCHYGFNRTGYFIVCYLVERCGLGVQDAIKIFARARPNGIRHSHFLDRLHVRYDIERGFVRQQNQN